MSKSASSHIGNVILTGPVVSPPFSSSSPHSSSFPPSSSPSSTSYDINRPSFFSSFSSPSPSSSPGYTLFLKSVQFLALTAFFVSPILIPLDDVNKSSVSKNKRVIVMLYFLSLQLWGFRIAFPCLEVGPPPLPTFFLKIHSFCQFPKWVLYLYRFWPCPILSFVLILVAIIIPCLCDSYPVPFLALPAGAFLGLAVNFIFMRLLYPKKVRTAEVTKKLNMVAKSLTVPLVYAFPGLAFLCGFYLTSALPQLALLFALNLVGFLVRILMRRVLRKLDVVHFEGPMLFYLFTLSQFFALQSLPKASEFYVVIASLVMKALSGIYPLIEWKKVFRNKVDVLPSDEELARRRSALSLFLFPIEEKEVERDCLASFVVMLSTAFSCIIFTPIYLFLYNGHNAKFFIYNQDEKEQLIAFLIYVALNISVAIGTYFFANSYFDYKFGANALKIGVEDFVKYFDAYFTVSMFALVIFVLLNMRHSNIVYYVAKQLYGV